MKTFNGKTIDSMTYQELLDNVKMVNYKLLQNPQEKIDGVGLKTANHFLLKELNIKKYEEDLRRKTLKKAGNWRREPDDPQFGEVTLSRAKVEAIEKFSALVIQDIFSKKKDKFNILKQIIK